MSTKIIIEQELQPIQIPEFIHAKAKPGLKQDGLGTVTSYRLWELTDATIMALCDRFREDMMSKAASEKAKRESLETSYTGSR